MQSAFYSVQPVGLICLNICEPPLPEFTDEKLIKNVMFKILRKEWPVKIYASEIEITTLIKYACYSFTGPLCWIEKTMYM